MTSARPVVFVDVDGVLVVGRPVVVHRPMGMKANGLAYRRPPRVAGFAKRFAPSAVAALNTLCRDSGAAMVMSSSWRAKPGARNLLIAAGVADCWHQDWATDQDEGNRGDQIMRWLIRHDHPPHVILDDWAVELSHHASNFVPVSFQSGLTTADALEARRILGTARR